MQLLFKSAGAGTAALAIFPCISGHLGKKPALRACSGSHRFFRWAEARDIARSELSSCSGRSEFVLTVHWGASAAGRRTPHHTSRRRCQTKTEGGEAPKAFVPCWVQHRRIARRITWLLFCFPPAQLHWSATRILAVKKIRMGSPSFYRSLNNMRKLLMTLVS